MKNSISISLLFALSTFLIVSCSNRSEKSIAEQDYIDSLIKQNSELSDYQKKMEDNKNMVATFYQQLFGNKNIDAIDKYIGDTYIQHNPALPDGKEALKNGAAMWFKGAPKDTIDIQHIGAEGNFVYIHTKGNMGGKTVSVIDIFRIENGKIVEHWDVIQEVPTKSANPHPMF